MKRLKKIFSTGASGAASESLERRGKDRGTDAADEQEKKLFSVVFHVCCYVAARAFFIFFKILEGLEDADSLFVKETLTFP